MLEQYITQLSEEIHLPPPPPKDQKAFFTLPISEKLVVSLKERNPGLFLTAPIAPLPTKNKENTLLYLMKANFLGQGTGGKVIGIDEDEKFLTLCHTIPYDVSYQNFKEIVEDFVNYLNYWQEECKKMQNEGTT